jgi:hypothetical protein
MTKSQKTRQANKLINETIAKIAQIRKTCAEEEARIFEDHSVKMTKLNKIRCDKSVKKGTKK